MKKLEIFIKPFHVDDVKDALLAARPLRDDTDEGEIDVDVTFTEVMIQTSPGAKVTAEVLRPKAAGMSESLKFMPRVKVELAVANDDAERIASILQNFALLRPDGGSVTVTPLAQYVDIHTYEPRTKDCPGGTTASSPGSTAAPSFN